MNNREAITLLRNLEDSLDSYCELNEEGKTAFRMAIEALNCSEIPNSSTDCISRQAAIAHAVPLNLFGREVMMVSVSELENLPSAQPEQKWIPCSERLPEQYGNYLVSYRTDDFESDIGTFDPDRINSDTGERSACDANGFYWVASKGLEVIAWMPLPESYREEKK